MTEEQRTRQIKALIEERAYLSQAGKHERIPEVEEQLRELGAESSAPQKRAQRR